jgi:predicted dehydrogenase
MNLAQATEMTAEARRLNRVLGVSFYRRFYPKLLKAKELMDTGAIGRPVLAELSNHGWFTPEVLPHRAWLFDPAMAGGGPLFDVGSHRLDVLNLLFGKPRSVRALLANLVHHYAVEDAATVIVEYENGASGVVDVRWHSHEPRDECRIVGTDGEIRMTPLNGPSLEWPGGRAELPVHANPHFPCIENFVSAVLNGERLKSSGESAAWTDWITEQAVLDAAHSGSTAGS